MKLKTFAYGILCPLLLSVSVASAQLRDRASLTHEILAKSKGVSAQQTEVNASERFFLDPDGAKLLTASIQVRESAIDYTLTPSQNVKIVAPSLTYLHVLNDNYTLVTQVRPGFFGDLRDGWGQAFRMEGAVFVSRQHTENLTLGYGVAHGSNFGRVITVPVLQVLYFPNSKVMIDALLPVRGDIMYLFSKAFEAGATFNIVGSQYRVDPKRNLSAERLQFANITIGAVARRQIQGQLYVTAELGTTVSRRVELRTGDELVLRLKPEQVAYGRIGLQYRF